MGDPIIEKDHIKDLGVYISSDLSWGKQIEEVLSKTISMSGWTLRTFRTREPKRCSYESAHYRFDPEYRKRIVCKHCVMFTCLENGVIVCFDIVGG